MKDDLIAQVIGRIPNLTDAQISAMNSVQLSGEAHIEADAVVGPEASAVMAQVHESVDAGVYAVARLAVLGILSEGQIAPESSATLTRYWTDIVEPLDESEPSFISGSFLEGEPNDGSEKYVAPEPVVEAPHTPTETELEDLGSPETVGETLAEEVTETGTPEITEGDF